MYDKSDYFPMDRKAMIRSWVLASMLKGAGAAALLLLGIFGFFAALRVVAMLLPENPNAALDLIRNVSALA